MSLQIRAFEEALLSTLDRYSQNDPITIAKRCAAHGNLPNGAFQRDCLEGHGTW